jgi:hypothetical protein
MHPLDIVEKVTKIIVGGVAALFFSYAGLTVNWERVGIQQAAFCLNFAETAEAAMLRQTEIIPDYIVELYSRQCDVDLEDARTAVNTAATILEGAPAAQVGIQPVPVWVEPEDEAVMQPDPNGGADPADTDAPGEFVAIGLASADGDPNVNFEIAPGGALAITADRTPRMGDILTPRWPVNLRENTQSTTGGNNASVGLLFPGECVSVDGEPVVERRQYWAAVSRVECPEA